MGVAIEPSETCLLQILVTFGGISTIENCKDCGVAWNIAQTGPTCIADQSWTL